MEFAQKMNNLVEAGIARRVPILAAVMYAFPSMRSPYGCGWEHNGGPNAEWLVFDASGCSHDFETVEEAALHIWRHNHE